MLDKLSADKISEMLSFTQLVDGACHAVDAALLRSCHQLLEALLFTNNVPDDLKCLDNFHVSVH